MTTCQHQNGCNFEGFSLSTEHGNVWYCRKHYEAWIPEKEFLKAVAQISRLNPDQKSALKEALK